MACRSDRHESGGGGLLIDTNLSEDVEMGGFAKGRFTALPGARCCCLCFKQTIGPAYRDLPGLESFAPLPLQPRKPNTGGASPATG